MTKKLAIFAGTSSQKLAEAVCKHGYDAAPVSDIEPDYVQQLKRFDDEGYDVAVIFDAAMKDKPTAENAILYFLSDLRKIGNKLRIIFVATKERPLQDPFITRLINSGVYDLIIPQAMGEDNNNKQFAVIMEMVEQPRNYSHARHYKKAGVTDLDYDRQAHKKVLDRAKKLNGTGELPKGQIQIGVIGASRFSGTSHIAQTIARSLYLAGIETALVVSREEDYLNIRDFLYRKDMLSPNRINVAGVDVYHGSAIADTERSQKATVYDFQVANLQPDLPKALMKDPKNESFVTSKNLTDAWLKCDCRVLCSGIAPQRLTYLEEVLSTLTDSQLRQLNIALNLSSDEMLGYISRSVLEVASDCNLFSVHEILDPFAATEIPDFVKSIMANDYDYTLKRVD